MKTRLSEPLRKSLRTLYVLARLVCTLWVTSGAIAFASSSPDRITPPDFRGCSTMESQTLEAALDRATWLAANAELLLWSSPSAVLGNGERYRTWFGRHDVDRYETVKRSFAEIFDTLSGRKITFDCGCPDDVYAHVDPSRPYEIFVCQGFWIAPSSGPDSQASTLIHELSHFDAVGGTRDHAHGQYGSRNLAQLDPAKAVNNATNYAYFAESSRLATGLRSSAQVHLRAANGQYLSAEDGGGGGVRANRSQAQSWETFTLIDRNGGFLQSGDVIFVLTSLRHNYLVAEGGGGGEVRADRSGGGIGEEFVIGKVGGSDPIRSGDKISLRVRNGNFVVAEGGGGGFVNANRSNVGPWETFTIIFQPTLTRMHLQTLKGHYLSAEYGGGGRLLANAVQPGSAETLLLIDRNGGRLMSGDSVNILAPDGRHYLVAEDGGGVEVNANRTGAGPWESFTIGRLGGGEIKSNNPVYLRAQSGHYVVAEGGGDGVVNANRQSVGTWEQFLFYPMETSVVHIRAHNGQYLSAHGGGGGGVYADRNWGRGWETFLLIDKNGGRLLDGDAVHLRTATGHYLVAEGGGGAELHAGRTVASTWETFRVRALNGTEFISNGDAIALQAIHGDYVVAEGGGGGAINANRAQVGPWETFELHLAGK